MCHVMLHWSEDAHRSGAGEISLILVFAHLSGLLNLHLRESVGWSSGAEREGRWVTGERALVVGSGRFVTEALANPWMLWGSQAPSL